MSREDLRAAADKEVDRWEQALADELVRLFDRQEAVVLARLQGTKARKHTRHWSPPGDRALEVKGILDPVRWLLDAAGSTRPVVTRLFGSVYGRVAKQLDAEPADEKDDRVEKAIERRLELISEGVKTAQAEVEALIKREEDLGTPMPQIVSQVQDLYHDRKPSWAARIATVSAVGSINQAAMFAAADAGSSAKQWLSRRDPKVRDTHEKADGQVRLLDERFRLGGIPTHPKKSLLLFPGDPGPSVPLDEIMNCRCTLLFSPPRKQTKSDPYDSSALVELATGLKLLEEKGADRLAPLSKPQQCKYCKAPATKTILHAEGRAYVPVCGQHMDKGVAAVGGQNEVDKVTDIVESKAAAPDDGGEHDRADREELEQQASDPTGRYVRTGAGAARFGQAIGEEIVRDSDNGLEYRRGTGRRKAPTTSEGYAKMFDRVPVEQWGGGDVAISHKMPDGRRVWAYGDTVSKNNGFVHSTAIVQDGGNLHVSKGGKQLLPDGGADPNDPGRQVIYWPDGIRQGPTKDTLIISAMEMSIGKANAFDFRHVREGSSREAVVKVSASGDLSFQRWKSYAPTPTVGNPHLANDFETVAPHSFTYGTVVHDIKLADGSYLTSRSRNYDDGFEQHMENGELRYRDWAPTYGSSKTGPQRKDAGELELKARVRTASGSQHYGQAIGSVIRRDLISTIPGFGDVENASRDQEVRRMVKKQQPGLDQDGTRVAVLRDPKGRVGAYVVWDKTTGDVKAVSVHPKLRGKKVGDQLVAVVAAHDPTVKPTTRLAKVATAAHVAGMLQTPAPARPVAPSIAPKAHGGRPDGVPKLADLSGGQQGGTTGDYDVDARRVDALHKAYTSARQDTSSLFSKGGRWTRERELEQEAIVDHFLNQPGVKADRKLLVMGGMPGAGKTTTLRSPAAQQALGIDLADYVTVNSDDVKAEMVARGLVPDYPGLSAEESMGLIQAESYEIAQVVMRKAATRGLNFAYDATLRTSSQLGAPEAAIARHAPPGYETTMVLVDVPMATAKQRARDRYLAGDRFVPLGFIDGMKASSSRFGSSPAENFEGFKKRVDRWVKFDNAGTDPVLVEQGGKAAPAPAAAASVPAAPASTVASMIPSPPPGAAVYQNRSGKVIHVLPDGSVVAYKPDGKAGRTTADAQKLADGYGDWTLVSGSAPAAAAPAAVSTPVSVPAAVPSSGAIVVPSALPPVPAGARVFSHPQGKHIYLLPDGSMQVYKPDGKRGTSSATAQKLLAGYGGWSELGGVDDSADLDATPTPAAKAPKLVAASSTPLDADAGTPAPATAAPVVPMDFNEMPLADVPKYIADPKFVGQQKVDGIRGVLVIEPGKAPWFASKKGDRLVSSTAARTTTPMLAKLPATPAGSPSYRVEGEILNGKFHVFDMVVVGQEQTSYEDREVMARAWVEAVSAALPQVEMLPTARTAAEKQALWDSVLNSGAEGMMFKDKTAGYNGGARVNHTLKAKITATADVVVLERNRGGKDNAVFGMLDASGRVKEIGTVSTGGKDKALGQITVGEVLELEYLWASPDGTLTQPRIVRKRKDKTPTDATSVDQLRFVDKAVLALAAKTARLRLEYAVEGSTE